MIIRYKFNDESVSEVEVPEDIGAVIIESRRKESNYDRKERYHCYSLDAALYEGLEYAGPDTPERAYEDKARAERISRALAKLSDTQRRRLEMLAGGMSVSEIARKENAAFNSVKESIEAARKKFLKHF